jgi:diguanylate cyclase (GGDEF)-like protein
MDEKINRLMKSVSDELERLDSCENAVCAVMGKLEDFTLQASRSSEALSDIWNTWNPLHKEINFRCWEIKNCSNVQCDAYHQEHFKCWMLTNTVCCSTAPSYSKKLSTCFSCEVMAKLREDTPLYLNELINILIKFLMIRDKDLVNIAIKDALTGVYNRFYFDEIIQHELIAADRHDDCLSVIMVDIDKFKGVNDTFGHAVGDDILRTVADMLKSAVRSIDMVFRLGGDEFLLVFPRTQCSGVDMVKDRLLEDLRKWNSIGKYKGLTLSLSLGCATWHKGDKLPDVLAEADASMYTMKGKL